MVEPGSSQPRRGYGPALVGAAVAGVLVGGRAGAEMRGSGMFFSDLIVAAGLLTVLAVVGVGALAAALTGRDAAARALAGFVGVTVIATSVAYVVAPPYRSPDAGIDHPGRLTVHFAEPTPVEWSETAFCRTREPVTPVFRVSANHQETQERTVSITLDLGQEASSGAAELWISLLALPAGVTQYVTSSDGGLDVTLSSSDGLIGRARFEAKRESGIDRSPDSEPALLTGTIEWVCERTATG